MDRIVVSARTRRRSSSDKPCAHRALSNATWADTPGGVRLLGGVRFICDPRARGYSQVSRIGHAWLHCRKPESAYEGTRAQTSELSLPGQSQRFFGLRLTAPAGTLILPCAVESGRVFEAVICTDVRIDPWTKKPIRCSPRASTRVSLPPGRR